MSRQSYSSFGRAEWGRAEWAFIVVFAWFAGPIQTFLLSDRDWGSPGHQIALGIGLIEIAVAYHLMAYPELVTGAVAVVVAAAAFVWGLAPTIYWEPWWVTSSLSVVGLVPLANGIRVGFGGGST